VSANVQETVTFLGTKKLAKNQTFNLSVFVSNASAVSGVINLYGCNSAGAVVESATALWSLTGGEGWAKQSIAYTVSSTTVDRIKASVGCVGSGRFSGDCAMLVQSPNALNHYINNANDGTAGVISADSAQVGRWDVIGYDVPQPVAVTHPWHLIKQGESLWANVIDVGNATMARRFKIDANGTLCFYSPMATGYADPTPLFTTAAPEGLVSTIDDLYANKLIGHGVRIWKVSALTCLWNADQSGSFPTDGSTGHILATVPSSVSFPDCIVSAPYWAQFIK
jgi:hypothetical protein